MQIDFHHAVTYVVARYADFSHDDAALVAHCAQYIDDATNDGTVTFDGDILYRRLSSAHKMLDYRNFQGLKNHLVWLPFHFLPDNDGLAAGENPDESFIHKLVCKPNSPIAQDMCRACVEDQDKDYALHRLGVKAHVFADTWAHQGFAGVNHKINMVSGLKDENGNADNIFERKITSLFGNLASHAIPPLGHGPALSYPDRPYASWSYQNGLDRPVTVERNNTELFVEAADELCKLFQRYLAGNWDGPSDGLQDEQKKHLRDRFVRFADPDGDVRHELWLDDIAEGRLGFPAQDLSYVPKGHGSWKHQAIGEVAAVDSEDKVYPYDEDFLTSNWKMFHDAAKEHRLTVIDDILPKYGICAA